MNDDGFGLFHWYVATTFNKYISFITFLEIIKHNAIMGCRSIKNSQHHYLIE